MSWPPNFDPYRELVLNFISGQCKKKKKNWSVSVIEAHYSPGIDYEA
jgi:hypothetical protein